MANPLICVFNPVTSFIDEVQSISTGPAAIGVPIVTNLNGVIDTSLLGIGSTATAGQAISSGTLVNLYSFGGTLHAQIATAQGPTFPNPTPPTPPSGGSYPLQAQGFAASSASLNQPFTVSFFGTFRYVDGNSEFNASTIGQEVYLSDRGDGSITLTPPSGPGELEQSVGYVVSFTAPNIVVVNFASGFQDFSHISGVNPITKGGTGATTGAQALINLIGGSPSVNQALIWNGSAWVPGTDTATFAQITTGVNNAATMTVDTGAAITFSGTGIVNANQLTGDPVNTAGRTAGQVLAWSGTSWAPVSPTGAPGSPTNSVQYNNAGAFGGSANFEYDGNTVLVTGTTSTSGPDVQDWFTFGSVVPGAQIVQYGDAQGLELLVSDASTAQVSVAPYGIQGNNGAFTSSFSIQPGSSANFSSLAVSISGDAFATDILDLMVHASGTPAVAVNRSGLIQQGVAATLVVDNTVNANPIWIQSDSQFTNSTGVTSFQATSFGAQLMYHGTTGAVAPAGFLTGINMFVTNAPGTTDTIGSMTAAQLQCGTQASSTGGFDQIIGINAQADHAGTGAVPLIEAIQSRLAFGGQVANVSAINYIHIYGMAGTASALTGSPPINGLLIDDLGTGAPSGSVTSAIRVNSQTGAGNFAINVIAGKSFLGDPVSITPTNAGVALKVTGDIAAGNIQELWAYNGGTPALTDFTDQYGNLKVQPLATGGVPGFTVQGAVSEDIAMFLTNGAVDVVAIDAFGTLVVTPVGGSPNPALSVTGDTTGSKDIALFSSIAVVGTGSVTVDVDGAMFLQNLSPFSSTSGVSANPSPLGNDFNFGSYITLVGDTANPTFAQVETSLTLNAASPSSNTWIGYNQDLVVQGSQVYSSSITGFNQSVRSTSTGTGMVTDLSAQNILVQTAGTGSVVDGSLTGIYANIIGNSTAGQTAMVGFRAGMSIETTCTDVEGFHAETGGGVGNANNVYGYYVKHPQPVTGTWSHVYGLYIDDQTTGGGLNPDPWAIYVAGGVSSFRGVATSIKTVTSTYSVTPDDHTINCNGSFTVTLPQTVDGVKIGQEFVIKNIGSGSNTVSCAAGIDGGTSVNLTIRYSSVTVQWDGTQYWIY